MLVADCDTRKRLQWKSEESGLARIVIMSEVLLRMVYSQPFYTKTHCSVTALFERINGLFKQQDGSVFQYRK